MIKKKQERDEEYKNLSYLEAGFAALGIETGNKKYDDINKEYLKLQLPLPDNNLGILQKITAAVGDGTNALQFAWEAAQVLPDLKTEYTHLKAIKNAANKSSSIEAGCNMIAAAAPLIKKCSSILHSESISNASKETILQYTVTPYVLTPILNKQLAKITKNFQSSETEKINVLEGINPKFTRELATLAVDIGSKVLESDLNPKVQAIYKNIKQKNEQSPTDILQNVYDIITTDKVSQILTNDLVQFLKNPETQKGLAQITENILNNKVQKFVASELIANTVELIANSSDKLVANAPLVIKTYNQFKENQRWTNTNLGLEGVDTESKKRLLQAKKPEVVDLLNNAKKIVDNFSPVLKEELLRKYLDTNKQNILDIVNHPLVVEKIKSSGIEPEFVRNAIDTSIPFLQDALPSITKLTSSALSDSDKVADILQKVQLIKSLPKEEKSKEVRELVSSVVQLTKNNPEIKQVMEKELPELLTKHAEALGPVVDEFLSKTTMGKKLKLDGANLVKIAGEHAPELIDIADKFSKREYRKMIAPIFKLSLDSKVLGVVAESVINLGKNKVNQTLGRENNANKPGPHASKILAERSAGKQVDGRNM